jgi:para-nitrobenzyl esterase
LKGFARSFLPFLCISLAACFISCVAGPRAVFQEPGIWSGSPLVTTRFGAVGAREDAEQTWVWKAIPFARPPVGDLRWRAPREPQPWTGVRNPASFSTACTQYSSVLPGIIFGTEDCLYLNVWRPKGLDTGLPVYVWIHGGGNSIGSATTTSEYYGSSIASRSHMVFVSINYRLGPFGWFSSPALREGASAEDASGNYGTLDIIQSLKWVRQNIEAFGGDPGNVTIAGESAGGFNVLSLLISPQAKDLFQRGISESGAAITHGMDEADAKSRELLAQLLARDRKVRTHPNGEVLAAAMSREAIRAYLRSKDDREILLCYTTWAFGMIDNPAILRDGFVIPEAGFDVLATGDYPSKVPLIIGSNKEEVKLFLLFSGAIPWRSELYAAAAKYGSDLWKAAGVDEVARRLSAHADQPPVYAYRFDWGAVDAQGNGPLPGNWGRKLGAFHSLDVPFFLGRDTLNGVMHLVLFTGQNAPGRKALSGAMMKYVAQFARTGNPNAQGTGPGTGRAEWMPWMNGPGAPKCILFNARGDSPEIAMSDTELTDDAVMAEVKADLAEPLRSRTLDFLSRSILPSRVR